MSKPAVARLVLGRFIQSWFLQHHPVGHPLYDLRWADRRRTEQSEQFARVAEKGGLALASLKQRLHFHVAAELLGNLSYGKDVGACQIQDLRRALAKRKRL